MVKYDFLDATLLRKFPGRLYGLALVIFVCQGNAALRLDLPVVSQRNHMDFFCLVLDRFNVFPEYRLGVDDRL